MTALAMRTLQFGLDVMGRVLPGHGFAPVPGQSSPPAHLRSRYTALYGPEISVAEAQRELGQRRGADVGFRANTGRSVDPRWMSAHSHNRTSDASANWDPNEPGVNGSSLATFQ